MMATMLNLLCAGAAQGLVRALQARFRSETGATVGGRFGAVGAMKEALDAGEACDVMVVTDAMVDALTAAGALRPGTRAPLGRVRTGIAVRSGTPHPDVSTAQSLRAALLAADSVYFPDAIRSTAGIHFASVLEQLGIHDELAPRFRNFPNGATAMRELASAASPHPIGCTQVTEIKYTDGVDLVALLPPQFELATLYTAAVAQRATDPELAARFIALLAEAETQALRISAGFEP
jgi:molybdate transport system substrate-binding protein